MAQILVVDDDEGVRTFIAEALRTPGHEVTEAGSGEEAFLYLQTQRYDLMITDLQLPGQGGIELLELLRVGWPDTRSLVLTAHGSSEAVKRSRELGAFGLLTKPVPSPASLRRLVSQALGPGPR